MVHVFNHPRGMKFLLDPVHELSQSILPLCFRLFYSHFLYSLAQGNLKRCLYLLFSILSIILQLSYYVRLPSLSYPRAVWPSLLGPLNTLTASLQKGTTPSTSVQDMTLKKSDGEVPVMLELWGMQNTLHCYRSGSTWPGVAAPDRSLSMGQIELNCVIMLNWIV